MEERGLNIPGHVIVNRWVIKYSPIVDVEFRKAKFSVLKIWKVDDAYIQD